MNYQNHLFFNAEGQSIEKSFNFDENAYVCESCFAMLNGEAVIFGGWPTNIKRQVTNSNWYCLEFVNFLDFCCFWMCIEKTW